MIMLGFAAAGCGGGSQVKKPAEVPSVPSSLADKSGSALGQAPQSTPPVVEAPPPPKPSIEQMALETQKRKIKAFIEHQPEKIASYFTGDALVQAPGIPEIRGRNALVEALQDAFSIVDDVQVANWRIYQKEDVAVIEWVLNGMFKGEFQGLLGMNKPIGVHGVSVVYYAPDGLIREEQVYFDRSTIASQVGVLNREPLAVPALPTAQELYLSKNPNEEEKNAGIIENAYNALLGRHIDQFFDMMSDDVEDINYGYSINIKGRAENKNAYQLSFQVFPDFKVEQHRIMASQDFVITRYHATGTQKAPFHSLPVPKKPTLVEWEGINIFQMKDGRIIRRWAYMDAYPFYKAAGLVKPTTSEVLPLIVKPEFLKPEHASRLSDNNKRKPAATPKAKETKK
ncbi:hypothetical protein BCY86_06970 [Pajaroellobacter abortibovis]|uniref:SnoaL-like domain-containing protein n=1 Tax=Pajaroellobacter abortibovis TaxID=1882918 RepID=A0A1L6MYG4_9BACT|nr:hypothetical protein BCY86_06970 [Pajaroellobacter abortibovis]